MDPASVQARTYGAATARTGVPGEAAVGRADPTALASCRAPVVVGCLRAADSDVGGHHVEHQAGERLRGRHRQGAGEGEREVPERGARPVRKGPEGLRSEEHTSELQSLMRISYAVSCLKKKTT